MENLADAIESRSFETKPDFDECMARIYPWYDQRLLDRPPVRFCHPYTKQSVKGGNI